MVVHLVEALCYNPEGRRFDSRWSHWDFSLTSSFQLPYDPGVDSVSNRNQYQAYLLGGTRGCFVWLKTLPLSYADSGSLKLLEPLRACTGIALVLRCSQTLLTFPSKL